MSDLRTGWRVSVGAMALGRALAGSPAFAQDPEEEDTGDIGRYGVRAGIRF